MTALEKLGRDDENNEASWVDQAPPPTAYLKHERLFQEHLLSGKKMEAIVELMRAIHGLYHPIKMAKQHLKEQIAGRGENLPALYALRQPLGLAYCALMVTDHDEAGRFRPNPLQQTVGMDENTILEIEERYGIRYEFDQHGFLIDTLSLDGTPKGKVRWHVPARPHSSRISIAGRDFNVSSSIEFLQGELAYEKGKRIKIEVTEAG